MNKRKLKRVLVPYGFLLPFLLVYACFFLWPAIYSLILSFFKYGGYGEAKFVGFQNYINLFKYSTMWGCLGNTAFYFLFSFIPTMIIAFLLANLVRSKPARKFQRIYKPLIFLPQICAVVASALCFKIVFGERVGVINQILGKSIPFLSETGIMRWTVVALLTWRGVGWYFIIFLSGLTTISDEIMEAASIDGATAWQNLRHIVIPMMKPTFLVAFVTNLIGSFKIYTEPNLLLSQNYDPSMKVAPYTNLVINSMSGGQFGMAAAEGWFLVIIILILTIVQLKLLGGDE
ncbi:MAG: sugar ABC transporter permease [Lachnospiraceae bacterium]